MPTNPKTVKRMARNLPTADVDQFMPKRPRAWNLENGGVSLLYEFSNQLDPEFGTKDVRLKRRLIEEVRSAFNRYLNHEAKTLDLAFNVCRPKSYRREAAKKVFEKKRPLQIDGRILRLAGYPAGEPMYEVLAAIHSVDSSLAAGWYAEFNARLKPLPIAERAPLPARFKRHLDPVIAKKLVFSKKSP